MGQYIYPQPAVHVIWWFTTNGDTNFSTGNIGVGNLSEWHTLETPTRCRLCCPAGLLKKPRQMWVCWESWYHWFTRWCVGMSKKWELYACISYDIIAYLYTFHILTEFAQMNRVFMLLDLFILHIFLTAHTPHNNVIICITCTGQYAPHVFKHHIQNWDLYIR